ncbi:MAG TPA: hypothetical protein VGG72_02750 [Bryobacteraceae bacterium]
MNTLNESESALLQDEGQRLPREHRAQRFLSQTASLAIAGLTVILFASPVPVAAESAPDRDGVLHLRSLVVEDQNGHERLRFGAPLPDPRIHGVRHKRSGAVSGLLISDAGGNEPGGYVTADKSGEAFVSLASEDERQVLFLANPKGGVNFLLELPAPSITLSK